MNLKKIMIGNQYLALLRGINVGGNNIIKMIDLKQSFEEMGFSNVITYIQSGNVLFSSNEKSTENLEKQIEQFLSKKFNYKSTVVVISDKALKGVVDDVPIGFGKDPSKYRYDVIFLKSPLTPKEAAKDIKTRDNVDYMYIGKNVIYFSRLVSRVTQSYISKIVMMPIYKKMTIRNWNTTTKLLKMMDSKI